MKSSPSVSNDSGHVCKLKKTLYGLKHLPRAWFEKLTFVTSSIGYVGS